MNNNEAALKALYDLLVTDTQLQTLMGDSVSLYHVMAKVDAPFPYLVHRLAGQGMSGEEPVKPSLYYLDIWDYSDTSARAWNIDKRITQIFNSNLPYSDTFIQSLRLFEGPKEWIPVQQEGEDDSGSQVWRYSCIYRVRYGVK